MAQEAAALLDSLQGGGPWVSEVCDGIAVDAHRARFAHEVWGAVLAHAAGEGSAARLAAAEAELEGARSVVARRHAAMHDPDPASLTASRTRTHTLYQYGYLRDADTLCYWERELAQAKNAILGIAERVPACVL